MMTYILKNKNLEIHIDHPLENYNFSRFDWTGKIVEVKFQGISLSSVERTDCQNEHDFGKGYYNEFGIDTALGFDETDIGGWYHKIGVGLLKKVDAHYQFHKYYEVDPAEFEMITRSNKVVMSCTSKAVHGYAYVLKKEIELLDSSFTVNYFLQNTGEKEIVTTEYMHNFMAINKDLIGTNYLLKFPFQLKPEFFGEMVNPEGKVELGENEIKFKSTPNEQFFYGNLTGGKNVKAKWELINLESKIGISETGNFQTNKINLWGWRHVISPELFFNIAIQPGESTQWSRTFNMYKVN
ncbi:hypothetical protein [Namhaeicola litoreus]|uniref:Aldose 1-epimerase n=1 Tax=Namhaeicola litoreus TaxID=1052145 RepID=A0ABW3Y002_9FLAO